MCTIDDFTKLFQIIETPISANYGNSDLYFNLTHSSGTMSEIRYPNLLLL